jgi:hypothetical protein
VKESQTARATHWLSSKERWTGQRSKRNPASKNTHSLSDIEQGTCKDIKRNLASEGYSRSVGRRAADRLGQWRKASQGGALTNCRAQSEGLVRTSTEGQLARRTHLLSSAERGIGQDNERNPTGEGHSLAVGGGGRDW